jgi:hypothetical protein
LGLLAEAQEKWSEAANHLSQALEIFAQAGDQNYTAQTIRILARVWMAVQKHDVSPAPDISAATIVARLAEILNVSVGEATATLEEHRDSRS